MINFHRLLITTAIMFCAAFAVWMFRSWQGNHGLWDMIGCVVFALLAVGLSVYLANLNRFLKT